jgi:hypothetical protein
MPNSITFAQSSSPGLESLPLQPPHLGTNLHGHRESVLLNQHFDHSAPYAHILRPFQELSTQVNRRWVLSYYSIEDCAIMDVNLVKNIGIDNQG